MELTLTTGARLRVRSMPTHTLQQLGGQEEAKIEPRPAAPTRPMKSPLTKAVEDVPAGEGDPEYDEWFKAMDDWTARTQEARSQINTRLTGILFDYGVIEWCLDYDPDRPDDAVWLSEPPEDWEFPPALVRGGLSPSDNPRLDYIFIAVIPRPTDYFATSGAIRADMSSLTEEEVAAQLAGFRPPGRPEEATRRRGRDALEIPRRAGDRKGLGIIARLLGKGVSR